MVAAGKKKKKNQCVYIYQVFFVFLFFQLQPLVCYGYCFIDSAVFCCSNTATSIGLMCHIGFEV